MNGFIRISDHCILKQLESFYLYDIRADELYQVDQEGAEFLMLCDGTKRLGELESDSEFITYCLEKGLIELHPSPQPKNMIGISPSPHPSLRYLEIQLTHRCNLSCLHCYLGASRPLDLSFSSVLNIMEEFQAIQGLRLILSGGEPLLYPHFWEMNDLLPTYAFRKVLLTNATLIIPDLARKLRVDEVQISLDGLEKGHEAFRGYGTYSKAIEGLQAVRDAGIDLSIATMLHLHNLDEIPSLAKVLNAYDIKEWGIDIPVVMGRLEKDKSLALSAEKAAPYLQYRLGGSYHGDSEGYSCGYHLCTIMPDGRVCQCGFFVDRAVGYIEEGLANCWQRIGHIPLTNLTCRDCPFLQECRGGCRYRALSPSGPDLLMCAHFGANSGR
jgi:radical SAM protein with 4Fe4S-binding SPASM domain